MSSSPRPIQNAGCLSKGSSSISATACRKITTDASHRKDALPSFVLAGTGETGFGKNRGGSGSPLAPRFWNSNSHSFLVRTVLPSTPGVSCSPQKTNSSGRNSALNWVLACSQPGVSPSLGTGESWKKSSMEAFPPFLIKSASDSGAGRIFGRADGKGPVDADPDAFSHASRSSSAETRRVAWVATSAAHCSAPLPAFKARLAIERSQRWTRLSPVPVGGQF